MVSPEISPFVKVYPDLGQTTGKACFRIGGPFLQEKESLDTHVLKFPTGGTGIVKTSEEFPTNVHYILPDAEETIVGRTESTYPAITVRGIKSGLLDQGNLSGGPPVADLCRKISKKRSEANERRKEANEPVIKNTNVTDVDVLEEMFRYVIFHVKDYIKQDLPKFLQQTRETYEKRPADQAQAQLTDDEVLEKIPMHCTFTIPVRGSEILRLQMVDACSRAGFKGIDTVSESAAAAAFALEDSGLHDLLRDKNFYLCDLGGVTMDAATVGNDESRPRLVCRAGGELRGGRYINKKIREHLRKEYPGIPIPTSAIEDCKRQFNPQNSASQVIYSTTGQSLQIPHDVVQAAMEDLASTAVDLFKEQRQEAMQASVNPPEYFVFCGGEALNRTLCEMIRIVLDAQFQPGEVKFHKLVSTTAVSRGAAKLDQAPFEVLAAAAVRSFGFTFLYPYPRRKGPSEAIVWVIQKDNLSNQAFDFTLWRTFSSNTPVKDRCITSEAYIAMEELEKHQLKQPKKLGWGFRVSDLNEKIRPKLRLAAIIQADIEPDVYDDCSKAAQGPKFEIHVKFDVQVAGQNLCITATETSTQRVLESKLLPAGIWANENDLRVQSDDFRQPPGQEQTGTHQPVYTGGSCRSFKRRRITTGTSPNSEETVDGQRDVQPADECGESNFGQQPDKEPSDREQEREESTNEQQAVDPTRLKLPLPPTTRGHTLVIHTRRSISPPDSGTESESQPQSSHRSDEQLPLPPAPRTTRLRQKAA